MRAGRKRGLDVLGKRLVILFASVPAAELTDEAAQGYREALAEIPEAELSPAFIEAAKRERNGFVPTPGQILEAWRIWKERRPRAFPAELAECEFCQGMGWETVERNGARVAVPCRCRRKAMEKSA